MHYRRACLRRHTHETADAQSQALLAKQARRARSQPADRAGGRPARRGRCGTAPLLVRTAAMYPAPARGPRRARNAAAAVTRPQPQPMSRNAWPGCRSSASRHVACMCGADTLKSMASMRTCARAAASGTAPAPPRHASPGTGPVDFRHEAQTRDGRRASVLHSARQSTPHSHSRAAPARPQMRPAAGRAGAAGTRCAGTRAARASRAPCARGGPCVRLTALVRSRPVGVRKPASTL